MDVNAEPAGPPVGDVSRASIIPANAGLSIVEIPASAGMTAGFGEVTATVRGVAVVWGVAVGSDRMAAGCRRVGLALYRRGLISSAQASQPRPVKPAIPASVFPPW